MGSPCATCSAAQAKPVIEALIGLTTLKLLAEATIFLPLWTKQNTALKRSALLLSGELVRLFHFLFA